MIETTLLIFLDILLFTLNILVLVRMIASWFANPDGGLMRVLTDLTEPVIAPVRRLLPSMGGFDLSPLVTLLIIDALRYLLFYV